MPRSSTLIVDKKTENGVFRCEERIKSPQFRRGVDYTVEGSMYFVLSNQLKEDILLIQNPYSDNVGDYVSDLEMKILVDHGDEINIKPRIVTDLEQRERLIEVGKGINDFSSRGIGSSSRFRAIDDNKNKRYRTDEESTETMEINSFKRFLNSDISIESANKGELESLIKFLRSELKKKEMNQSSSNAYDLKSKLQKSEVALNNLSVSADNVSKSNSALPVVSAFGIAAVLIGGLVIWKRNKD